MVGGRGFCRKSLCVVCVCDTGKKKKIKKIGGFREGWGWEGEGGVRMFLLFYLYPSVNVEGG